MQVCLGFETFFLFSKTLRNRNKLNLFFDFNGGLYFIRRIDIISLVSFPWKWFPLESLHKHHLTGYIYLATGVGSIYLQTPPSCKEL